MPKASGRVDSGHRSKKFRELRHQKPVFNTFLFKSLKIEISKGNRLYKNLVINRAEIHNEKVTWEFYHFLQNFHLVFLILPENRGSCP